MRDPVYTAIVILQFFNLLWVVGLTVFMWLRKPGLDAAAGLKGMEEEFRDALKRERAETERELRSHALKLADIQAHMEHMPSSEEMAELRGQVNGISERLAGVSVLVKQTHDSVESISRFLRENR